MRLVIDECIDERMRHLFPGHECQTARFANLAGLNNGCLLESAEEANSLRPLIPSTALLPLVDAPRRAPAIESRARPTLHRSDKTAPHPPPLQKVPTPARDCQE